MLARVAHVTCELIAEAEAKKTNRYTVKWRDFCAGYRTPSDNRIVPSTDAAAKNMGSNPDA
jgi:hypothetical protein